MKRLVSLEKLNDKSFQGIVAEKAHYVLFLLSADGIYSKLQEYPKKDYKNYDHFANVIGKFDPYILPLVKQRLIEDVTTEELERIYVILEKEGLTL